MVVQNLKRRWLLFFFWKNLESTSPKNNKCNWMSGHYSWNLLHKVFLHILRHEQHVIPSRPNSICKSGVSVLVSNSERIVYFVFVLLQSSNGSIKRSWKWWAIGRSLMRVTNSRKNIREWSCRLLARILRYIQSCINIQSTLLHTHTHTHTLTHSTNRTMTLSHASPQAHKNRHKHTHTHTHTHTHCIKGLLRDY